MFKVKMPPSCSRKHASVQKTSVPLIFSRELSFLLAPEGSSCEGSRVHCRPGQRTHGALSKSKVAQPALRFTAAPLLSNVRVGTFAPAACSALQDHGARSGHAQNCLQKSPPQGRPKRDPGRSHYADNLTARLRISTKN